MLFLAGCGVEMHEDVAMAYENLQEVVDFNIHIKPIISDRCYQCHDPDEQTRGVDLRLDNEEGLFPWKFHNLISLSYNFSSTLKS
ncbi:hypothetical protein [Reichenbachiella sp. MALMAid0571]|uniref:hypothetical protein n=1 Tax=Reichenbachiella sp. MALMAid0571 TaxID=3143939 RepID=UPI0032DED5E7